MNSNEQIEFSVLDAGSFGRLAYVTDLRRNMSRGDNITAVFLEEESNLICYLEFTLHHLYLG